MVLEEGVAKKTVVVSVPELGDCKGDRWANIVDGIRPLKRGKSMFPGKSVNQGCDVETEPGSLLLVYGEKIVCEEQIKPTPQLFKVLGDGSLKVLVDDTENEDWDLLLSEKALEFWYPEEE